MCEEAGRLCEEVGARQLMLTNFRVPREYDADREAMYIEDLCTAASRVYSGPVEAAEDCKLHSVDAVVREDEA